MSRRAAEIGPQSGYLGSFAAPYKNEDAMTDSDAARKIKPIDEDDRAILRELQKDATRSLDRIATLVGLSKTAVWNRIQRLTQEGVILRQVAILDPKKVGLNETFYVSIRTSHHNSDWLDKFQAVIASLPEITEAHRLAGSLDYLIKVQVASTVEFDQFYKKLVSQIDLYDVNSSLSMEIMKHVVALPV